MQLSGVGSPLWTLAHGGTIVNNSKLIRMLTVLVLGSLVVCVVGCETTKGVGRDITNIGEASERAISQAFDGDAG